MALAIVLSAGAGLRLYKLDDSSVWADEMLRILWSKGRDFGPFGGMTAEQTEIRKPVRTVFQTAAVVNKHDPPLNGLLMNVWMHSVGSETDFALRLYSAIVSLLAVLGAFLAGRELGGLRTGITAAALIALSPFHVYFGQEVNHYALASCLIAFCTYFYWRMLRRPSWPAAIGLFVFGTAALYAHYFCGLVLLCQGVGALAWYRRDGRGLGRFAAVYVAMLAAFLLPQLPALRQQIPELTAAGTVGAPLGFDYLIARLQDTALSPWIGWFPGRFANTATVIAACVIPFLVAAAVWRGPSRTRVTLAVNVFGPLVLIVVLFGLFRTNSILWPRYQVFFSFATFLAVAHAIATLPRPARFGAATAVGLAFLLGLHAYFGTFVRSDWKQVAAVIERTDGAAPVLVSTPNMTYSLARYLQTPNVLQGIHVSNATPEHFSTLVGDAAAAWLALSWTSHIAPPANIRPWLQCRFERRELFPEVRPGLEELVLERYSVPRPGAVERCRGEAPGAAENPLAGG